MRPIRLGIIGLGFGRRVLAPAFKGARGCKIVGLCGRDFSRARRAASQLGIPRAYSGWKAMLDDPRIDAVAIALPPAFQPAVVLAAAARGKHVFCEKPLAIEVQSADEMLRAARKTGIVHMVDFEFPEIAVWRKAALLLRAGRLGRLRQAIVSWEVGNFAGRRAVRNWKDSASEGGGVLNSHGSHVFYYIERLLGRVEQVSARLFSMEPGGGETTAMMTLRLKSGIPVSVSLASNSRGGSWHNVEICGERGSLILRNQGRDYARGFLLLSATRGGSPLARTRSAERSSPADGRIAPVRRLAQLFLRGIWTGKSVRPDLSDGCRVQRLIEAARRSSQLRRWIKV